MKYATYEKRMQVYLDEGKADAEAGIGVEGIDKHSSIDRRNAWLVGWRNGGGDIRTGKVRQPNSAPGSQS